MNVLVRQSEIQDDGSHIDPILSVLDRKSKDILSQTFSFIDVIGGKSALNHEGIEKFMILRGIVAPSATLNLSKKECEQNQFYTEGAFFAGEDYALATNLIE